LIKKIIFLVFLVAVSADSFANECPYGHYSINKIESIITKNAKELKVDEDFIWAIISVESYFNPCALSVAGAMGLMQLMPGTADMYNVADAYNPEENIRAGTELIAKLFKKYKIYQLVLSAYNAGPTAVKKYRMIPPYAETKRYIRKVVKSYKKRKMKVQPEYVNNKYALEQSLNKVVLF